MNIPTMMRQIYDNDFDGAAFTVTEGLVFPGTLGYVCPAPYYTASERIAFVNSTNGVMRSFSTEALNSAGPSRTHRGEDPLRTEQAVAKLRTAKAPCGADGPETYK